MNEPRDVGFAVRMLTHSIRHYMEERGETEELTHMQGRVIHYLSRHEGEDVFQRDLEKEFQIRRSTATGMLQVMERNGLITREPVCYDARLKKLVLTAEARAGHDRFHERVAQTEKRITRGVSQEELDAFFQTVDKFIRNLETDGGQTK